MYHVLYSTDALFAMRWLAWSALSVPTVVALYWLYRNRPLIVCTTSRTSIRQRHKQRIVLLIVLSLLLMLIYATYAISAQTVLHDSDVMTTLYVLLQLVWEITAVYSTYWQTFRALSCLSDVADTQHRMARQIITLLSFGNVIHFVCSVSCIVTVRVSTDSVTQMLATKIFFIVHSTAGMLSLPGWIAVLKLKSKIEQMMRTTATGKGESYKRSLRHVRKMERGALVIPIYLYQLLFAFVPAATTYYIAISFVQGSGICILALYLFYEKEDSSPTSSAVSASSASLASRRHETSAASSGGISITLGE